MARSHASSALAVLVIAGGIIRVPAGQAPPGPTFEVASIRPNKAGPAIPPTVGFSGGRFLATNATVRELISFAYDAPLPADSRIIGLPGWTVSERFDIVAKLPDGEWATQIQAMLRVLLAERFGLVVRSETRQVPVYALLMAHSDRRFGPKLRASEDCSAPGARPRKSPAATNDPAEMCGGGRNGTGRLVFGGMPISVLADTPALAHEVQRVVVDRTALTGFYDASLEWTPTVPPPLTFGVPFDPPPPPPDAPSIFVALQEQLGLKLEPSTAPLEVFIIERVERPTPN